MSCHQKRYTTSPADEKQQFYKHLKVYLIVVGITMFSNGFGRGAFNVPPFAMWWGIGVAIHYLNVFGWESLFKQDGDEPTDTYRDDDDEEAEPLVELGERVPRRQWRDRDLV